MHRLLQYAVPCLLIGIALLTLSACATGGPPSTPTASIEELRHQQDLLERERTLAQLDSEISSVQQAVERDAKLAIDVFSAAGQDANDRYAGEKAYLDQLLQQRDYYLKQWAIDDQIWAREHPDQPTPKPLK